MAGNDMPLFTSGKPRLPMACLRAWEQYNEPSLISVASAGGRIYCVLQVTFLPTIEHFIIFINLKKHSKYRGMLTWWSKKWIWLALVSFRNISSIFPVWKKNKNALAKHMWLKQTVTQWLFLRRLVTNRRCKFLLKDISCPDRWLNCPLRESRECHASDTGDKSPQNKQTQIWAWHFIYHCGTERSCNWKFNWLKGQREEIPLKAKAARFLRFNVTSLTFLWLRLFLRFGKGIIPFKHFMNRRLWIKLSLDKCIPCPGGLPAYALRVQIHDSSFAVLFSLNALTCHYRGNCYDSSRYEWMKKKQQP